MLSKTTLRNIEIVHHIGNYLGIIPIKVNLKLGIFGNCKLSRCPILWTLNSVFQIIMRIAVSGFFIHQILVMPEVIPSELASALSFVILFQFSIIITIFYIFNGRSVVNLLNKFLNLNQSLCKS